MTERRSGGSGPSPRRTSGAKGGTPRPRTAPTAKKAAPKKATPKKASSTRTTARPSATKAPPRRTAPTRPATRRPSPVRRPAAAGTAAPGNSRARMRALMVTSLIVLSLFAAQLLRIQGFDSEAVAANALAQRTHTETIPAQRGTIYGVNGTVLAQSQERRIVTVDQTAVPEYEKTVGGELTEVGVQGAAEDLATLLDESEGDLAEAMTGEERYVVLAKNVSPLTWRRISDLGIPGIYSERTSQRTYPQSTTVASLVGFVQPQDQSAGAGLELQFDDVLSGEPGRATYQISQDGSRLPNASDDINSAEPGRDIRLTIDNDIQWYAQNALASKVEETKALSGTVVVQDVNSGELVALASYPTFDPNDLGSGDGVYTNLAFSDVFEPGSTAKIMTVAAGLEEDTITPQTPMVLPYSMRRGNATLKDSHPHPDEYRTVAGALAQSSNTGMMLIGETMEPKTLEEYLRRFGLGSTSGSGFPGESGGLLPPAEDWSGSQRYTMTYGQGVSTTAVQVTNVFQAIANDGLRISPTFVDSIEDEDGNWRPAPEGKTNRAVSKATANQVSRMLEGVVSEDGTAPEAQIEGYSVAGKTGTADRYDPDTGGYSGKTASFIGYAPADDPQLVISVILQRPINGYYGGTVAAPVFKDVMTYALQKKKVPPTPADERTPKVRTVPPGQPDTDDPDLLRDRGAPDGG
ncbi:penicillin-binding protein 2 [Janibacter sp. DB-40]|uniref:peptidoglycan D,D-transpeptidase FtsI family protein n=1 Tax=Janibacter sp. DB-40 TaxID=3028808 RepID=UPI0024050D24|nr:penicillin-binding protein 2 [Janibacter sp. DB-40]